MNLLFFYLYYWHPICDSFNHLPPNTDTIVSLLRPKVVWLGELDCKWMGAGGTQLRIYRLKIVYIISMRRGGGKMIFSVGATPTIDDRPASTIYLNCSPIYPSPTLPPGQLWAWRTWKCNYGQEIRWSQCAKEMWGF